MKVIREMLCYSQEPLQVKNMRASFYSVWGLGIRKSGTLSVFLSLVDTYSWQCTGDKLARPGGKERGA